MHKVGMTAHELAGLLLEGDDVRVVVLIDSDLLDINPSDFEYLNRGNEAVLCL